MPNPFDQFDANPFDQFDEPSLASDVSQSALGGLIGGILGIQGSVGDADRAIQTGTLALADRLGFGPGRTVLDRVGLADTSGGAQPEPFSFFPTTQQLRNTYESVAGPIYEPKTVPGEYAQTLGEFAPAAFGGASTRLGKVASAVVPALMSETAGQAARRIAPEYEDTARVTGGLLGSLSAVKNSKVPSTDELRAAKDAAYAAFDSAGAVITPRAFRRMVADIVSDAQSAGVDRGLHKTAIQSIRRLADEIKINKPRSLQEIEQLRRIINGAGKVPNISPDERRIVSGMVDKLDDFVEALPANPKAIATGDPASAIASLKQARELNRQYRRSELVDDMWERAGLRSGQFSVSGQENAIRTEFRQLGIRLTRNKNLRRLFTKEERDAIAKVANPGPIENRLRNLGKLAPAGSLPLFGGGLAIGSDPGGLGLVAGGLFGLGSAAHLGASGLTNLNVGKARNAMLGLPPEMLPVAPALNPFGASAATLPVRQ